MQLTSTMSRRADYTMSRLIEIAADREASGTLRFGDPPVIELDDGALKRLARCIERLPEDRVRQLRKDLVAGLAPRADDRPLDVTRATAHVAALLESDAGAEAFEDVTGPTTRAAPAAGAGAGVVVVGGGIVVVIVVLGVLWYLDLLPRFPDSMDIIGKEIEGTFGGGPIIIHGENDPNGPIGPHGPPRA